LTTVVYTVRTQSMAKYNQITSLRCDTKVLLCRPLQQNIVIYVTNTS